jgi:hypothetical protein
VTEKGLLGFAAPDGRGASNCTAPLTPSKPLGELNSGGLAGQLLDNAAFAFLVLTAEDEQLDGSVRSRENMVHESGLFQGRRCPGRGLQALAPTSRA